MEYIPQNPDGYIFCIVGGSAAERATWVTTLRKVESIVMGISASVSCCQQVSAVGDAVDEWSEEISDNDLDGGLCVILWLSNRHIMHMGNMQSQIISAHSTSQSNTGVVSETEVVAQVVASTVEEDQSDPTKEDADKDEEGCEGELDESATSVEATVGGVSFTMGESSIG